MALGLPDSALTLSRTPWSNHQKVPLMKRKTKMEAPLFSVVFFSGLFALACCLASLLDPSKKGQVLFRLKD
jgi:hypothetical protein